MRGFLINPFIEIKFDLFSGIRVCSSPTSFAAGRKRSWIFCLYASYDYSCEKCEMMQRRQGVMTKAILEAIW